MTSGELPNFYQRVEESGLFYSDGEYGYRLKGGKYALVSDSNYNFILENVFNMHHITVEKFLKESSYEWQINILFNLDIFSKVK